MSAFGRHRIYMDTVHWGARDFRIPASDGATRVENATSFIHSLRFADGATQSAYKHFSLPLSYSGSGLVVRVGWSDSTGSPGNLRCTIAFERYTTDLLISASNFASRSFTIPGNGTASQVNISDLAFTHDQLGGMVAGDLGRFRIQRLGGDPLDTLNGGNVHVQHVQLVEEP